MTKWQYEYAAKLLQKTLTEGIKPLKDEETRLKNEIKRADKRTHNGRMDAIWAEVHLIVVEELLKI